jgi:hypothetical protein
MKPFPDEVIPLFEILQGRFSDVNPLSQDVGFQHDIRMNIRKLPVSFFNPHPASPFSSNRAGYDVSLFP